MEAIQDSEVTEREAEEYEDDDDDDDDDDVFTIKTINQHGQEDCS